MTDKEFISQEINRLKNDGVKNFPDDYLNSIKTKTLKIPGKTLFMGNYFFNKYEIITADGSPVFHEENIYKAKYIIYSSLTSSKEILIPDDDEEIKFSVENYEKYLDSVLIKIYDNFSKSFPGSQNKHSVSNEIFRRLNLVRI